MELILVQKVANLGNLGDKVKVRAGYGRNFLVPYGKAVPATKANLEAFEAKRATYEAAARDVHGAAESRKAAMEGKVLTIHANASTEGKLYGSIGAREIAEAMTAQGMPVKKVEVEMGAGVIRRTGEAEVTLRLHADVTVAIKVLVEAA
jgi:large subunit ribosomal protein L9